MAFETQDIERHLLNLVTTDKVIARSYLVQVEPQWFTGLRTNIFLIVQETFEELTSLLTDHLYVAEISK